MAEKKRTAGRASSEQSKRLNVSRSLIYRICDFMASACCVFDVDWDNDFDDDEYVIENRKEELLRRNGVRRWAKRF